MDLENVPSASPAPKAVSEIEEDGGHSVTVREPAGHERAADGPESYDRHCAGREPHALAEPLGEPEYDEALEAAEPEREQCVADGEGSNARVLAEEPPEAHRVGPRVGRGRRAPSDSSTKPAHENRRGDQERTGRDEVGQRAPQIEKEPAADEREPHARGGEHALDSLRAAARRLGDEVRV